MQKPGPASVTEQSIDSAASAGLPVIEGHQAVAEVKNKKPGQPVVYWYWIADGSEQGAERIVDANGKTAEWPA